MNCDHNIAHQYSEKFGLYQREDNNIIIKTIRLQTELTMKKFYTENILGIQYIYNPKFIIFDKIIKITFD